MGGVALLLVWFAGFAGLLQLGVRPRLAIAPGFVLADENGSRLTSEDLRGTITVYTFSYAHAADPLRDTNRVLQGVHEILKTEDTGGIRVRLITVSFDPARDDAVARRAWAERLGADDARWSFATGSPDTVERVVRDGFGLYYEPAGGGRFYFNPLFVVVDGLGIVRSRYPIGLPSHDDLVNDIRSLVREAQAETGSLRLAYRAAHFFSCYTKV